jgi:glycosyltransferase involved in cell wall biosynthesis
MKILHLSTRLNMKYGGGEKFLEQLITSLDKHEHIFIGQDEVIYNIFKKHAKEAHYSSAGYEPITLKRKFFIPLSFILGFLQFIRYYKFFKNADIIFVSASSIAEPIFLLPWIQLFFPKKRLIQTMHCMCIDYYWKNPLVSILRKTWSKMEFIFISQNQMNDWKTHNLSGLKNYLIYNGVEIHEDNFKSKTNLDVLNIGYIGRMYYQKGVDTMIKAISKLDHSDIKINLLMAGEGEDLDNFVKLQKSLKYKSNIEFKWLGFESNTKEFYEKCDLIIFPSWIETFSLVLLEAWERGLPVITSNIPAFIEAKKYMPKMENDLTFSLKNEIDLAKKINYFIKNLNTYTSSEYKNNLHNCIKIRFSKEKVFSQYNDLLKNKT